MQAFWCRTVIHYGRREGDDGQIVLVCEWHLYGQPWLVRNPACALHLDHNCAWLVDDICDARMVLIDLVEAELRAAKAR